MHDQHSPQSSYYELVRLVKDFLEKKSEENKHLLPRKNVIVAVTVLPERGWNMWVNRGAQSLYSLQKTAYQL